MSDKDHIWELGYTQNRELSWLQFNARVLEEAEDEEVPLLERLKFLAIFTSNLDEFFMIRVGSLTDLSHLEKKSVDSKSGWTPEEQLQRIYAAVRPLYTRRDRVHEVLSEALCREGLCRVEASSLQNGQMKAIRHYFRNMVEPVLSPQIVDAHHPFPHLEGKVLHIAARLKVGKGEMLGLIPVPASLPALVPLPGEEGKLVPMESILLHFADQVFGMYEVLEKVCFCITRNADVDPRDEAFDVEEDFRRKMEKVLRQRRRLGVVRVEVSAPLSSSMESWFRERFDVKPHQIFVTKAPMRMDYAFSLGERLPQEQRARLSDPPFAPQRPSMLDVDRPLLPQVLQKDALLSYPYESMDPFLALLREAAGDPDVLSIRITIYRLARRAKLVDYLCAAAENGKDVTVLIELRARFDEQNNIDWSERLEEAGCKIIYGFEDYKVHSKICLITRRSKAGIQHITQVGTGNYNEKTARQYTDVSLLTANPVIGADAAAFFQNMALGNLDGRYDALLVAPRSFKDEILRLIGEQAARGTEGYILLKFNSLTDVDVIRALSNASCAGVKIELIIRGICCLRPGIRYRTEHISVVSVVGRFLEHSRIFCFGRGAEEKMYIGSADRMTRNTERRVEIACPVWDEAVRKRLHEILDAMRADTVKARELRKDGSYVRRSGPPLSAQECLMRLAITRAEEAREKKEPEPPKGLERFLPWLRRQRREPS